MGIHDHTTSQSNNDNNPPSSSSSAITWMVQQTIYVVNNQSKISIVERQKIKAWKKFNSINRTDACLKYVTIIVNNSSDDNVGRICARSLKDYNKSSLRSRMNYPNNDKDKKNNDMNDATDNHHDKIRVMINNDDDNEHCTIIKKEKCAADPSSNNNNMNSSAPTPSYRVDQTTTQPLTPQEQHQKENQNQIRKQQVIKTPKIVWLQRLIPRGRIDITYNDLWYALLTIGIQYLEKFISIVKYVMSWDFIIDTLLFIFGLKSFFKRGKAYSIENDNEDDEQQQRNKKRRRKKEIRNLWKK